MRPRVYFLKQFMLEICALGPSFFPNLASCICALSPTYCIFSQIWGHFTLYHVRPTFMKSIPILSFFLNVSFRSEESRDIVATGGRGDKTIFVYNSTKFGELERKHKLHGHSGRVKTYFGLKKVPTWASKREDIVTPLQFLQCLFFGYFEYHLSCFGCSPTPKYPLKTMIP